jgi:hypothetical protein
VKEAECSGNNHVLMYKNGKMRHVETIPGMGEGKIRENDVGGVNSAMVYVTMCPQHSNSMIIQKNKRAM